MAVVEQRLHVWPEDKMVEKNRKGMNLLDEVLERRMLLYVLAAGATLATASAAQAKVVFTPSHAVIKPSSGVNTFDIDLNNDGVVDFSLTNFYDNYSFTYILQANAKQPGDLIARGFPFGDAAALKRGNPIGSSAVFTKNGLMAYGLSGGRRGHFWGTSDRYLGVKFAINGEVHYGWIGFRKVNLRFIAVLGGWAYETVPNTPIRAGEEGGESDFEALLSGEPAVEPTSLELLAMGRVGIADRQRRIAGTV